MICLFEKEFYMEGTTAGDTKENGEFKERINLVHSLQDFIGFSGL